MGIRPVAWVGLGLAGVSWLGMTLIARRMPSLETRKRGPVSLLATFIENVRQGWQKSLVSGKRELAVHSFLLTIRIFLNAVIGYCILLALGLSIPFLGWLGVTAIASLLVIVPTILMGLAATSEPLNSCH